MKIIFLDFDGVLVNKKSWMMPRRKDISGDVPADRRIPPSGRRDEGDGGKMSDCTHIILTRLEDAYTGLRKQYQCQNCKEILNVALSPYVIGVSYPERLQTLCKCGHTLELHDDQAVCRALVDGKKSCQCLQYNTV